MPSPIDHSPRKSRARPRLGGSGLRLAALLYAATPPAAPAADASEAAAALRARHAALRPTLAQNAFQRPISLESTHTSGALKGDIYAVIEQPYELVNRALQGTGHWSDILILHLNVKACRPTPAGLSVRIGKKYDQALADAQPMELGYRVNADTPEYLCIALSADHGPLGTHNYRIELEAIGLDARSSFIHLSYAYSYGLVARAAMLGYLNTLGRRKVGFSIVGRASNGQPIYVGDMRGVVERNTMRYYLAIDAYLGAYTEPPPKQLEKRLRDWFTATERYPLQLHELELNQYLEMKRREVRRQQAAP